ncbi:hypothetical protein ABID70_002499 [Clavibacter michiganensis]|uniref:hypothetical protein n=1 Tax=Clavibacter michiganensis TaxID=28447 RepID=UPI001AE1C6BC|nr:hypothetical protein [Clavibacter michiganensis]MBP2456975.1 hypothetical protein [Clavibacter michiganensis]MDQ0409545.1 hypothetical protein [Clavibacter michiganensis]
MQLTPELAAQLARVPRTHGGLMAPCRITLRSGHVRDRVRVAERAELARAGIRPGPAFEVEDVARIEDSPLRLPAELAERIHAAGESGMGYLRFLVRMRDGSVLPFVTGGSADFPDWPPGADPRDAVDVVPHGGREVFLHRPPTRHESGAPAGWLLYDA